MWRRFKTGDTCRGEVGACTPNGSESGEAQLVDVALLIGGSFHLRIYPVGGLFGVVDAALKNRQHRFAVLLAVLLFALLILGHPDPLPVSGNAASEDTRA